MPDQETPSRSAAHLIIGCKLPHGVLLEMGDREDDEAYRSHRIIGVLHAHPSELFEGAAITRNIPTDFWEAWMKTHSKLSFVKREFIFASAALEDVQAWAFEQAKRVVGLEGVDPFAPPKGIEIDKKSLLLVGTGTGVPQSPYAGAKRSLGARRGAVS